VEFSDQAFEYSDAEISARIFSAENSVADFLSENSAGRFSLVPAQESSGVSGDGVVRLSLTSTHPDFGSGYGSSSSALARSAMTALASHMNLAAYDRNADQWLDPSELAVVVLVAGFEQAYASSATTHPRIWAHKSSVAAVNAGGMWLSEYAMFGEQHEQHLATIGLMAHELGHLLFDLPDLYDSIGVGEGLGRWGLMSFGTWNAGGGNAGDKPAHLVGWAKEFLGFTNSIKDTGGIYLEPAANGGEVLRIELDEYRHGKHLLVENRTRTGYDAGLPAAGLLVTEVDDWHGYGVLSSLTARHSERLVVAEKDFAGTGVKTDSTGIMLLSADELSLSDGQVLLDTVSSGENAQLNLRTTYQPRGYALGYDEVPANASWGTYGGRGYALVYIPLTSEMLSIDGIDFYAHGSGELEFGLYASASRYSGEGKLGRKTVRVQEGWNRLFFDTPPSLTGDSVYLQLISEPDGDTAPFLADIQGSPSGLTQVKEKLEYTFSTVDFDLSVKVLISTSDQPIERAPATESQSSATSGGAFQWFTFVGALLLALRRYRFS
ncbi:MAG: M6 family metalloprotease domain-containing protein, partial [Thalassolituus sp.]